MKKFFYISILALILSGQTLYAQLNPSFSKSYSNEEIEKMVMRYELSYSQDVRPNNSFVQQLKKDFPNARDIEWETVDNIFEADFEIGNTDYKAYYDKNASLLMYVQEIREPNLPAIVKNAAMAKYPNCKFDDIKKIIYPGGTFYKVEMDKDKSDIEYKAIFKDNGSFVKEIAD